MTTYRVCFCFKRRFTASNETPEVIKEVFRQYSENGVMGLEELRKFMVEVQGDKEVTREEAQAIIDAHHEHNKHVGALHHHHHLLLHHHRKGLTLEGFFHYVFSDVNNLPVSSSLGVHQDMNAPLSHYFIYTGHNSYLTGNQISSVCSEVPIVKALKKGVRVIELDMWPNSTKDDIDILHGGTLTTPVELIKCLRSIKEHAFTASPYPVILTLEDHLTPDLQAKAAKMISETFGESLFVTKSDYLEEFPSPEELKMKIIISTKPPKEYLESKSFKDKEQESPKVTENEAWGAEVEDLKLENELQIENEEQEDEVHGDTTDLKSQPSLAPEYKHLIAIKAIKRMSSLKDSLMVDPNKVTRLSLGEQKFAKAVASHPDEVVRFTQRNLLRIYPKATRVTSSNYNPLLGWTHGAQMVALNMQGYGRSLWLMQGMFRANGECGYVKKPDILMEDIFNPKAVLPVKKTLKVTVYMGDGWRYDFGQTHFDTYSPPDFYTRIGIAGVQCDTVMKRTKAIEDNWSPVWNEEFVFPLCVPELALLIIEVHEYDMNEKDDFGGQTCLPVWELRPGIRTVRLCDRKGDQMNSVKLLMRFEFI